MKALFTGLIKNRDLPKNLCYLFILMLSLFSFTAKANNEFTSGEGTAASPYVITTAEQLQKINDYPAAFFKLGNNIDLTEWINTHAPETGWNELCRETTFTGELDGNGHGITGLWINKPAIDNVGLFAQIGTGAVIRRLAVRTSHQGVVGNHRVAAVVGGITTGASNVSIESCMVEADIKGFQSCGAIIGHIPGVNPFAMKDSYVIGTVTATKVKGDETEIPQYAGGLIGYVWGKTELNINNCYAANVVNGENEAANIGGLIGVIGGSKKNNTWAYLNKCIALNPEISTDGEAIGRVYGGKSASVVSAMEVYALAEMKVTDKTGALVELLSDKGGQHGESLSWEELTNQATYEDKLGWAFMDGNWKMTHEHYLLPIRGLDIDLANQPVAMPASFDYLTGGSAIELPAKLEVMTQMALVNNYYMANNVVAAGSNDWVKSAYFAGCMEFYKVYRDQKLFDYMTSWAERNQWDLGTNADKHGADGQVCGQTYIDLYLLDEKKDEQKIHAIKACIDDLIANPEASLADWWWVDSYFMAMPIFSKLGALYQDDVYFERMHAMHTYSKTRWELYDETEHTWFRDSTQVPAKSLSPNQKKVCWSRGNGWVIAACVRVLNDLPADNPYRVEYIRLLQEMAEMLKACQREDGFWNRNLTDPEHLNGPETSGTALFTYGLAWGINQGILDKNLYLPVVLDAWNGMVSIAVKENGLLGYVQGPGYKPESKYPLNAESTWDYGVGAFLMAGSEVVKLAKGEMPEVGDLPEPPTEVVDMNVTASAYESGTANTPDKTLDRDFNTRWSAEGEQWIKYDLLSEKTVTTIDIAFWDGHKRSFFFSIELSADDENWIEVFNGQSGGKTDSWETFEAGPRKARYVRINGRGNTKNQWNSILETRINTEEGATDVQEYIDEMTSRLVDFQLKNGYKDPAPLMNAMNEDGSWPDIDYNDTNSVDEDGWQPNIHFCNMIDLAVAYRHPQSPYYKNASLLEKIVKASEFIHEWIGDPAQYDKDKANWWWDELGDPQKMMVALILIKGDIPAADLKRYSTFLIDRTGKASNQGKNMAWAAEITLYKGCIEDNYQMIFRGFSGYASIIELVPTSYPIAAGVKRKEGIQYDYSFHQHRRQLQAGSYGLSLIPDLTNAMAFASGTPFDAAFTKEKHEIFSRLMREGHMLFSYRGTMDFGCKGRAVIGESGFDAETIEQLKHADPDYSDLYAQWKDHLQNGSDFPTIGNKYFWNSNLMTHHGAQYYLSAKIPSTRNVGTECINQENLLGRNLPKGATNILTSGKEYYEIAPVWDWTRIPGTTAVQHADGAKLKDGYFYAYNEFGGGVTDGRSGIIAYEDVEDDPKNYSDALKAKKSYFFMGDALLCLGAGISDTGSSSVITSVNQALRDGDIYYSDGTDEYLVSDPVTSDKVKWVLHNKVGYLFPSDANVTVQGKDQTGSWNKVNGTKSTDPITRNIFSVWINHGENPVDGSYQYIVLPNRSDEDLNAYAANPLFSVIQNDSKAAVVYHKKLNQYGVVCYASGTVKLNDGLSILCDKPCIFLLKIEKDQYTFSIADPMYYDHNAPIVKLTVSKILTGNKAELTATGKETILQIDLPNQQYTGSAVTKVFTEDTSTGVQPMEHANAVTVYPNPVSDVLNIGGTDDEVCVSIYNAVGQKVMEAFNRSVNITSLSNGVYFVKVRNEVFKVIKQ